MWGEGFRDRRGLEFRGEDRVGELEVAHLKSGFQARWVREEIEQARAHHLEMTETTREMSVTLLS